MRTGDERPTLEGLSEMLETQTKRLEALERENAELRGKVTMLEGPPPRRGEVPAPRGYEPRGSGDSTSRFEGKVSRRSLLSKAGVAAVAAVAAGTLLSPRQARAADNVFAENVYANGSVTADLDVIALRQVLGYAGDGSTLISSNAAVAGRNQTSGPGIEGISSTTNGAGVLGRATQTTSAPGVQGTGFTGVYGLSARTNGWGVHGENPGINTTEGGGGVRGQGRIGVWGVGSDLHQAGVKGEGPTGVWGLTSTTDMAGVYGEHTGTRGHGTVGIGKGGDAGVLGRNGTGVGVRGEGGIGVQGVGSDDQQAGVKGEGPTGVWGLTSKTSYSGVYGEHTGTSGHGTVGIGKGGDAGVLGRNGAGEGVRGEGKHGVVGVGDGTGYGGQFEGGKAQLKLKPGGSAGKPSSGTHAKGEIYMDSAGTLFVCVAGTTSTAAARWKKISATAV